MRCETCGDQVAQLCEGQCQRCVETQEAEDLAMQALEADQTQAAQEPEFLPLKDKRHWKRW
jgi:hypothetical protein